MSEKYFSARLAEALDASGLSQTQVANIAGITAPYLSDLKKGKRENPSPEVVRKLAAALSVTPAWLMSYTDESSIRDSSDTDRSAATFAESSANPKESQDAFSAIVREEPTEYRAVDKNAEREKMMEGLLLKLAETQDLEWLQHRILEFAQEAANGDAKAGNLVSILSPIVARRLYPEKYQTPDEP